MPSQILIKLPLFAAATLAVLAFASNSKAQIINTGAPGSDGGYVLGYGQGLAAEFSLSGPTTVTALEGWIGDDEEPYFATGGTIYINLLANDPDSGTNVYSGTMELGNDMAPNWNGVSGLDLNLGAGNYWLEFTSSQANAYMPGWAPQPLPNYAFNEYGGSWSYNSVFDLGIQVYGTPAVPDAASSAWLCASTALMLLGAERRLRSVRA